MLRTTATLHPKIADLRCGQDADDAGRRGNDSQNLALKVCDMPAARCLMRDARQAEQEAKECALTAMCGVTCCRRMSCFTLMHDGWLFCIAVR
jgi:hypothetical protein